MITLTQAIIDAAITKAKCCYANLSVEFYAKRAKGYGYDECIQDRMDVLNMAIFSLEHYYIVQSDERNCITADELYKCIENINNACGCDNC